MVWRWRFRVLQGTVGSRRDSILQCATRRCLLSDSQVVQGIAASGLGGCAVRAVKNESQRGTVSSSRMNSGQATEKEEVSRGKSHSSQS